jgi:LysR family transcriptional regulator, glycine cleavage system transcriptional activator
VGEQGLDWGSTDRPGAEFEHYYYTLEAATAGLGVALAPRHLVAADLEAGRLMAPLGFLESEYRYIARRRRQRSKAAELFCAWLQVEAASEA